jgi:NAD(P)-dependent dehydrogenase (short-subunit alcohol dehydrogenase family)
MNWTTDNIPSQHNRIAIVTGANSGIGFETAKALAEKDATVILACRNLEKAAQAATQIRQAVGYAKLEIKLEVIGLDLADLNSVREFAKSFHAKYSSLDLLINNAGIMIPPFSKTKDGFELQFGSNHLGHFALTGLLMPAIRATPKARVVNVSSSGHGVPPGVLDFENLNAERKYSAWTSYMYSKLSNLLFTLELNQHFLEEKIDAIATSAHPGYTATGLQKNMQKGIMATFNEWAGQHPAMGALPTLYAAIAPEAQANDYIGPKGFMKMRGHPERAKPSNAARDERTAQRLWKLSEQLTGVNFK